MPKQPDIKFVEGEFQRVSIDKDDVIVLSYPGVLPMKVFNDLKAQMNNRFPGYKTIILEQSMKIGVLSPK